MSRETGPYPFPRVPLPVRHFVALAAVVIAFTAWRRSGDVIDEGGLFLLLGITVIGAAWFAGTGSALAVTILGSLLGASIERADARVAVHTHLALFVLEGLLLTALVAELRRARNVAERAARAADQARHDAEAASRTKDEFLGTISHELRTPLNAVLGWLHLVRSGKLDPATEARGLDSIERNVRLQAQMTADLLDVSKALTGRLNLEISATSMKSIVEDAIAQVETAADAKDVTLHAQLPSARVIVRGDPNRLRQVVWHLLANAIKFTPRGGAIDVSLEANDHAYLVVRDSGPGIDASFLPHIFDRFAQADSSPTRVAGGLGVGLALVRELVERHGGEIRAANAESGGAVFTVRLPLRAEDQKRLDVRPAAGRPGAGSPPLDGIRVLLLDHDEEARELMRVVLQQRGACVRAAESVGDALEMLESWRPDVLVSDRVSPEHDRYSVVGKVQSLEAERGGRIPALALTSLARTDESMRRMLSSVKRDLPKPVEPAVLTAEIARLTGRERRRVAR